MAVRSKLQLLGVSVDVLADVLGEGVSPELTWLLSLQTLMIYCHRQPDLSISKHIPLLNESFSSNIHFSFFPLTSLLFSRLIGQQARTRHCNTIVRYIHHSSLASSAVSPGVPMTDLLLREFPRIPAASQTSQAIVLQENSEYDDTALPVPPEFQNHFRQGMKQNAKLCLYANEQGFHYEQSRNSGMGIVMFIRDGIHLHFKFLSHQEYLPVV